MSRQATDLIMRAIITLVSTIVCGVAGGLLGAKIGSLVEASMTEEEKADFLWVCRTLHVPVPDDPQNPGLKWQRQVDQKFDDLPEEKQEEVRRRVKSLIDQVEGVQV